MTLKCCCLCFVRSACYVNMRTDPPCPDKVGSESCESMLLSNMCRARKCTKFTRELAGKLDEQLTLFEEG